MPEAAMDEFALIDNYFRPLAQAYAPALELNDDAALMEVAADRQLVITTDTLISGVHFIGNEDASLIARKALRVSVSDLAAMGAEPLSYFLALSLPAQTEEEWVRQFAHGLFEDQQEFGISLAGGDTTATPGPLGVTITATGLVPRGEALLRSGAKAGDDIYMSGTLGDAALGLLVAKGKLKGDALKSRYLLPQPRVALGRALRGIASACMDISDGLVQDVNHLCAASGIGAIIEAERVALSEAAAAYKGMLETILTGGDDYELVFTAPADKQAEIALLSRTLALPITRIGKTILGGGVAVLNHGTRLSLSREGYRHFA